MKYELLCLSENVGENEKKTEFFKPEQSDISTIHE